MLSPAGLGIRVCTLVVCGQGWHATAGPPLCHPHCPGRWWPWGCTPGWLHLGECRHPLPGSLMPWYPASPRGDRRLGEPQGPEPSSCHAGEDSRGPRALQASVFSPNPSSGPEPAQLPASQEELACGVVCTSPVYISCTNISPSAHLCKHSVRPRSDRGALAGRGPHRAGTRADPSPCWADPVLPGSHAWSHRGQTLLRTSPRHDGGTCPREKLPCFLGWGQQVGTGPGCPVPPRHPGLHEDQRGGGYHRATGSREDQTPRWLRLQPAGPEEARALAPLQAWALVQTSPEGGMRLRGYGGASPGIDWTGQEARPGGDWKWRPESGGPAGLPLSPLQ